MKVPLCTEKLPLSQSYVGELGMHFSTPNLPSSSQFLPNHMQAICSHIRGENKGVSISAKDNTRWNILTKGQL